MAFCFCFLLDASTKSVASLGVSEIFKFFSTLFPSARYKLDKLSFLSNADNPFEKVPNNYKTKCF